MKSNDERFIVTKEYVNWIESLKEKIKRSQIKASVQINYELLDLYWALGKEIVEKQKTSKWGEGLLDRMSKDLKHEFPGMSGFSVQNLRSIKYWYSFYTDQNRLQLVSENINIEELVKSIPWGHNQRIMYKCKDINEAVFYVRKTIENNWSRSILQHQIDSDLFKRQGKAVSNFHTKLPDVQSELAEQTLKNPYNFDFLMMRDKYDEKELESALIDQITNFLLELGTGFSYMGRQVHVKVGDSDFYIDLLFYHTRLHCYIVVELKTDKFKPEYIGKLNFYITAINKQFKSELDKQTIGLLICKDKDDVVAEYALEEITQPIGIANYKIETVLSDEIQSSLPTIEEIEKELLQ